MKPAFGSQNSGVVKTFFGRGTKYLKRHYLVASLLIAGLLLKVSSDLMAWHNLFGRRGAALALASAALLFLSSVMSVKLGILTTIIALGNGALCYRVIHKLLEHNDIFGTDPYLSLSVWAWLGVSVCSLVGVLIACRRKQ